MARSVPAENDQSALFDQRGVVTPGQGPPGGIEGHEPGSGFLGLGDHEHGDDDPGEMGDALPSIEL
jgi:hypothetical protein